MEQDLHESQIPPQKIEYGRFRSYAFGFLWSVVLTFAAYLLVTKKILSGPMLDVSVALLAIVQAAIQLVLFLHLGKEEKPRWNLMVFLFMLLVVVVLVFGSIWIMNNLNYQLMM